MSMNYRYCYLLIIINGDIYNNYIYYRNHIRVKKSEKWRDGERKKEGEEKEKTLYVNNQIVLDCIFESRLFFIKPSKCRIQTQHFSCFRDLLWSFLLFNLLAVTGRISGDFPGAMMEVRERGKRC